MFSPNDNPFAVLTAVVAPAVLTNASSVLCLGISNRIARVVDRTRIVAAEIAPLQADHPEHAILTNQLGRLQLRSELLFRALRLSYASLGSFAAAALISVVGSALAFYEQACGQASRRLPVLSEKAEDTVKNLDQHVKQFGEDPRDEEVAQVEDVAQSRRTTVGKAA